MKSAKKTFDISKHLQVRRLEDLVENRTSYTTNHAELNIYETHQKAERVELTFSTPVLASMIRGKKVMHLKGVDSFAFLPNESVIVPSNETMTIDFPEANLKNPTQCLALAISPEKVQLIIEELNEKFPMVDSKEGWKYGEENFYFTNDNSVNYLLSHLIHIFTENNTAKDFFADFTLKELIIRLLQTNARSFLIQNLNSFAHSNRLAYALKYIEDNLHQNLSIAQLSEKACMSEPTFYRIFKNQLGISPIEYINQKRIDLAKKLLAKIELTIADISFACGYNNLNHFFKLFKKYTQATPAQYRKQLFANKQIPKIPLSFITDSNAF